MCLNQLTCFKERLFSWEPAQWTLMSQAQVRLRRKRSKKLIAIFTCKDKHWLLSIDMKKNARNVPRITRDSREQCESCELAWQAITSQLAHENKSCSTSPKDHSRDSHESHETRESEWWTITFVLTHKPKVANHVTLTGSQPLSDFQAFLFIYVNDNFYSIFSKDFQLFLDIHHFVSNLFQMFLNSKKKMINTYKN